MYSIIDTHCDTAEKMLDNNLGLDNKTCMLTLSDMNNFKSYIQVFAAWVGKREQNPKKRAINILTQAKEEIKNNNLKLILNLDEIESVKTHGGVLALEDARSLEGDINNLKTFYDFGVRSITLAWNDDNDVLCGANTKDDTGLTDFGRQVVSEMNRLNMIVDVSHASQKSFWDILEVSNSPVLASHSNCYSQCRHVRNLKDDQIKALIRCGGLMGINIAPFFLEEDEHKATIKSVIRHINHALSLGAEDNLCLGSDFDGIDSTPNGFNSAKDYIKLIDAMKKENYPKELIDKITYKNFIKFSKKFTLLDYSCKMWKNSVK